MRLQASGWSISMLRGARSADCYGPCGSRRPARCMRWARTLPSALSIACSTRTLPQRRTCAHIQPLHCTRQSGSETRRVPPLTLPLCADRLSTCLVCLCLSGDSLRHHSFRDGHLIGTYTGERSAKQIIDWAQTQSIKPARPVPHSVSAAPAAAAASKPAAATAAAASSSSSSATTEGADDPFALLRKTIADFRVAASHVSDAPARLLASHPLTFSVCLYLFGVLSGFLIGVLYALREKTRIHNANHHHHPHIG
jgi:hypothetical protein